MYLSDLDLKEAIKSGQLIFDPPPEPDHIDPTSIDLLLDEVTEAKIWDMEKYSKDQEDRGEARAELRIAKYNLSGFSSKYLCEPPEYSEASKHLVQRRLSQIIVRPSGFVLWQTKAKVGTPPDGATLICFVDGKSTRARAGIVVHLTAPTIHAGWAGKITLEIVNLGPFDLVLQENDVIAQLTVAQITRAPEKLMAHTSVTHEQKSVDGTS